MPDMRACTVPVVSADEGWPAYLRGAMAAAGMRNAAELARAAGIGEAQVSRWLRGATTPEEKNLRRLSKALKRPMLELLVAAGHLEPEEARMKDQPAPPAAPVGGGVDPELLAELQSSAPDEIEKVKAYLRGIRDSRR